MIHGGTCTLFEPTFTKVVAFMATSSDSGNLQETMWCGDRFTDQGKHSAFIKVLKMAHVSLQNCLFHPDFHLKEKRLQTLQALYDNRDCYSISVLKFPGKNDKFEGRVTKTRSLVFTLGKTDTFLLPQLLFVYNYMHVSFSIVTCTACIH